MKFQSKKDLWLGLLIWIPIGGGLMTSLMNGGWFIKGLLLTTSCLVAWIWFVTYYYISDDLLMIRCGPFKEKIKIEDIKSIKKTRNPISSAALSLDRMEIRYGDYGMTIISPKHEEEFINLLIKQNKAIDIKI
jgi:hypothetical protein